MLLTLNFADLSRRKLLISRQIKWRLNAGDEREKVTLFSADVSYNVKVEAIVSARPTTQGRESGVNV